MAPFDCNGPQPERTHTLAGLIEMVNADQSLLAKQKRDFVSAVNSFANHLGLDLNTAAASLAAHRERLQKFNPAAAKGRCGQGLSPKTWSNILSNVRNVLARYRLVARRRRSPKDLRPLWRALREQIVDIRFKRGLSALIHYCSAQGYDPNDVDDAVLLGFLQYLVDHTSEMRPDRVHQRACKLWNHAVEHSPGWPQRRLTVPNNRRRVSLHRDQFPASFWQDVAAWRSVMTGDNLIDPRAPEKALAPSTMESKQGQIWRFASALVHSSFAVERITGLAVLVQPSNFAAAINHYRGPEKKDAAGIYEMARTIVAIAEYWVRLGPPELALLKKALKKLNCRKKGMTERNMQRLRPLFDPVFQQRLLDLPQRLRALAKQEKHPKQAAHLMQQAAAIEILLVAPVRLGNLLTIRFGDGGHLTFTGAGASLEGYLSMTSVKTRVPLNFEFVTESARILKDYVEKHLPRLAKDDSRHLFPGQKGGHKTEVALRDLIKKAVKKHVGVDVHPHLFRHFAAKHYLDTHPGEYALVSRLLGHKSVQTTMDFYLAFESEAAAKHYFETVLAPKRRKRR